MSDIRWQKSSYSMENGNNDCLELARNADAFLLRESDEPAAVAVTTATRTRALLAAVKRGAFGPLT